VPMALYGAHRENGARRNSTTLDVSRLFAVVG
jgi:hypothetical protein